MLHFWSSLEEQLRAGRDQVTLQNGGACFLLFFDDFLEDVGTVFNVLAKLTQNPDICLSSICFSNLLETFFGAEWHKTLNEIGVLPENVLEHDHCFIGHVVDPQTQEVSELLSYVL